MLFATGILHWRKKDILTAGEKIDLRQWVNVSKNRSSLANFPRGKFLNYLIKKT
jgi:hypothetical protein